MAEWIGCDVTLWDGWQLRLPNDCMAGRNADGSWSAWDEAHAIDVHIVTVGRTPDGGPMDATTILGREPTTSGPGWTGVVEESVEADVEGPALRFAITAAADHTFMSCWVAYRDPAGRAWAETILAGIRFDGRR